MPSFIVAGGPGTAAGRDEPDDVRKLMKPDVRRLAVALLFETRD